MKLNEIRPLTEGFFKNEIDMTVADAKKISGKVKKNWVKGGTSWTIHNGEDHLFTYNTKRNVLMTDMSKKEVMDIISG